LSLPPGTSSVTLEVGNRDGFGEGFVIPVAIAPQRVAPPVVRLTVGEAVNRPQTEVEVAVQSASPLSRVQLIRRSPGAPRVLKELVNVAAGDLRQTIQVELMEGVNKLELVAVNAGGSVRDVQHVAYVADGARIYLDRLGGVDLASDEGEPIAAGAALLEGRVVFANPADPNLQAPAAAHVYVNGFLQRAKLEPPERGERRFQVNVLLHHRENNHVRVELPSPFKTAQGGRSELHGLACQKPVEQIERLYLLLVSLEPIDAEKLKTSAIQALGARPTGLHNEYTSPAFSYIYPSRPLIGPQVQPVEIAARMALIRREIELLQQTERPDAVVMMYYHGRESVDSAKGGFAIHARGAGRIEAEELHALFQSLPAATLLMLDVIREAAPVELAQSSLWPSDSSTALVRSSQAQQTAAELPLIRRVQDAKDRVRVGDLKSLVAPDQTHIPNDLESLVIREAPGPAD
jgi:hypothetical protein